MFLQSSANFAERNSAEKDLPRRRKWVCELLEISIHHALIEENGASSRLPAVARVCLGRMDSRVHKFHTEW